jgi:hypothetical protein
VPVEEVTPGNEPAPELDQNAANLTQAQINISREKQAQLKKKLGDRI